MSKYTKRQLKYWKGKQSAKKRIHREEQLNKIDEILEEDEKKQPDEQDNSYK